MEKDKNKNNHEDWSEEIYGEDEFSGSTFILTPEKMAESSLQLMPSMKYYKVNTDKIKTIKDIKLVLKHMNLSYCPADSEAYEEIKHLLVVD